MTPIHELTTLYYSDDRKGPWKLYIYMKDGYHTGGQWFTRKIRYPDEEITVAQAKLLSDKALEQGLEIRIADGGDMLVFHASDEVILYPKTGDFWKEIAV